MKTELSLTKKTNYQQALKLPSIFADEGDVTEKYTTDEIYALGFGVGENEIKFINTFTNADNQGALWMIHPIAKLYIDGDGVLKNKNEAAYWGSEFNQFEKETDN